MNVLIYLAAVLTTTISFALISILGRLVLRKGKNSIPFRSFVPLFLLVSAIITLSLSFAVTGRISLPGSFYPLVFVMGALYTAASYIVFYSLENEKGGLIGTVNSTQVLFIAFFSSLLFVHSDVIKSSIAVVLMLIGVFLVSANNLRTAKFSKFVFLALFGTLLWVAMWLLFYGTLPSGVPSMLAYGWLSLFAFVACIPAVFLTKQKLVDFSKVMRKSQYSKYILLVSVVNSIGTILYSYTYVLNAVLTPLIVETEVFFVLVLAYFLLKERFKIIQILGALIVVFAVFFFLLV